MCVCVCVCVCVDGYEGRVRRVWIWIPWGINIVYHFSNTQGRQSYILAYSTTQLRCVFFKCVLCKNVVLGWIEGGLMGNTVELNSCHCWLSKMSHIQTTHLLHSNVAIQRLIIHLSPNPNYFKCESHPTSQRRPHS